MSYEAFKVTIENHIAHVAINRPDKANSLNKQAWHEMKAIFEDADKNPAVRVVILSGKGKNFCAGIDLSMLMDITRLSHFKCEARKREQFIEDLVFLQECINAIEKCRKPVIAAIQRACVGGGVDVVSACDMRYATEDTYFCVKEVDMGLVADIGTMQRLPKLIPYGVACEMSYTGRKVFGAEAQTIGLVNRTYSDYDTMMEQVQQVAATIAAKSPVVIRGTKQVLQYNRDHSVEEGLKHIQLWNAAMIFSTDIEEAFKATMERRQPVFED
ncbi:MAG: crotonase/enoyl-CoA hydratase family protein [Bacteroidota bacterium]